MDKKITKEEYIAKVCESAKIMPDGHIFAFLGWDKDGKCYTGALDMETIAKSAGELYDKDAGIAIFLEKQC